MHFQMKFAIGLIFPVLMSQVKAQCPTLIWSDEFEGNSLDLTKWSYEVGDGSDRGSPGWGSNQWQFYTQGEDNVQVSDGRLKIIAKYDESTDTYTSGRLSSLGKADFDLTQPLRMEASIRIPKNSVGLWPSFSMLPSVSRYNQIRQINIMDFIGKEPNQTYGFLHYGIDEDDKNQKGALIEFPEHLGEYFHHFAVEKTENTFTWFVDGNKILTVTSEDIQPKYEWTFESVFHFVLNMAVGGDWPHYPDDSTEFPAVLEIDYVRVYDLATTDHPTPTIEGDSLVRVYDQDKQYCISVGSLQPETDYNALIEWWIPPGSYYSSVDNKPNCIRVDFGRQSGYVEASVFFTCGRTYELWLPIEVQDYYSTSYRFWAGARQAQLVSTTGTYTEERDGGNDNAPARIIYQRNQEELYDNIIYSTNVINNPQRFVDSSRKFYLDAYSSTAAPCTAIWIQLEDSTKATADNYPTGRHSRYLALLEKGSDGDGDAIDYQKLEFDFYETLDSDETLNVDQVSILIDSYVQRSDTYYLENFVIASAGCSLDCSCPSGQVCDFDGSCRDGVQCGNDGDCEYGEMCGDQNFCVPMIKQCQGSFPLSRNTCQIAAKSEEGACADGFNNDGFGWNGDSSTDCEDSDCYLIDPACNTVSLPPIVEICDNGIDDDQNGLTDCDDDACADSPSCGTTWNPSCGAFSSCVEEGHVGDCCPNPLGEYKDCCNDDMLPSSCRVHPECAALGLIGECCPTPNETGSVMLDCCQPELCATNPQCTGLEGACCPTSEGVFLECCEERPESCKIHPQCSALGLTGQCCPTTDNEFLDCCEDSACAVHPACEALGLADECCPTRDGIYLDCCDLDMPFFEGYGGEVVASKTP